MNNSHTLAIESPILKAFREGVTGYQPEITGHSLAVECCDSEASLSNLCKLAKSLRAVSMSMGPNNTVFVQFESGEQYVATGFGIGYKGREVAAFARAATMLLGGDAKGWYNYLSALPKDWAGPLLLPVGKGLRLVGD